MKNKLKKENKELKNVLILEDRYVIRKVMKYILKEEGFSVFEAENGVSAVEHLNGQSFDLFILDGEASLLNYFIETIQHDYAYSKYQVTPIVLIDDDAVLSDSSDTSNSMQTMSSLFQVEDFLNTVDSLVIS